MVITLCILIGAAIGGLVPFVFKSSGFAFSPTLAVGILGALLGLVTDKWINSEGMTDFIYCEYVASATGAVLALFVWMVAHRLFFDEPMPTAQK